MNEILVASAVIGNLLLVWLLIWQGWSGRLQWFTVMTALAVLMDCLGYFVHGFDHALYQPLRIFVLYWTFPILEALCAWEAWRIGIKWLEWLMLIQVGIQAVALGAHLHGNVWAVYRIEIFADWVDVGGILLSCWKFRKEANYESP